MNEYITKEDAQLARPEWRCRNDQYDCGWNDCINEYLDMIDTIPAADVVPVRHGRWIDLERVGFATWETECSCCGVKAYKQFRFCPNCGARMDGESNV